MVESQSLISTLALVDTLDEQIMLEAVLERSKPNMPAACAHLHYLLAAPFRYGCYPANSRFRRKGQTPGVFYGAEQALTAAMETVWYRLKFFAAAPDAALPQTAAEYSAFSVEVATKAIDLTASPLAEDAAKWADPDDYTACLSLADVARAQDVGAIRYQSVRDPQRLANLALLSCGAFAKPAPTQHQTWRILLRQDSAVVIREWPHQAWEVQADGAGLVRNL